MEAFLHTLEKHKVGCCLKRGKLTTLQVNLGNLCNQSCLHCHIDASPHGKKIMSKEILESILAFLSQHRMETLDITGGAPELNPFFDYFIQRARDLVDEMIVRSNLTVFFEEGKEYLPQFFKKHRVHLIGSLPCYCQGKVDAQRGNGAFAKSIKALGILNELGFSRKEGLALDLVYNPSGAVLPPDQGSLEKEYKQKLKSNYGVDFNRLVTITNVPIKRFKTYLKSRGEYDKYFELLKDNFNPLVVDNLMCRTFLSVGYDGKLYDCDFNQALGLALQDADGHMLTIDMLDPAQLQGRDIIIDNHCFSCTAGSGSSCQGALDNKNFIETASVDKLQDEISTKEVVKAYYGKILQGTKDLKTSVCCAQGTMPATHKEILSNIEPEILKKFYGCGSPMPPQLKGCTVLDLGCGTGRDVYLASYLVGEGGRVIGIDMTDEQLAIARKHAQSQMRRFDFAQCNVDFKKGYIEDLREIGVADNSVDVAISNCVINLSPDKEQVFSEIFRVLKEGGELYFSDVFAGRRIPDDVKDDPVLYGECLGGALYIEDFRRMLRDGGCRDYRIVSSRKLKISNPDIHRKIGMIDFYSMTIRAFKLSTLEDICEDYGQTATYLGTIPEHPHEFILDDHHVFATHKPLLVCGNTASMLNETRYKKHFRVSGDRSIHFGAFSCSPAIVDACAQDFSGGGCC